MRRIALFICILCCCSSINAQFSIGYNKETGAVNAIVNTKDTTQMNWLLSSSDSLPTWQKPQQDWGMGKFSIAAKTERWSKPSSLEINTNKANAIYTTTQLSIAVQRSVEGNFFTETYQFKNTTGKAIQVDSLSIYTPFNDNYPNAKTCATNRCNAHIWPGLNSAYVNAIRMDGDAPHLGLVFTQGAMKSYSVENRGIIGGGYYRASDVRGTIVLNMPVVSLKANETYTVQWKLFWHKGWADFYTIAKTLGFVKLDAAKYVVNQNEVATIIIDAAKELRFDKKPKYLPNSVLGEHTFMVSYANNKQTILNYSVISSPEKLIDKRVHFIVGHQQMNNLSDSRYGAYMVYDNDADTIFTNPKLSVAPSDKDEGRERIGMGLFIAKWLQTHKDTAVNLSLLRYISFVRNKLQTPDYKVFSNVAHTSRHRGYNYPWVADLYLQMYHLTADKNYLKDYCGTLNRYYKEFGYQYYAIGITVKEGLTTLQKAGMQNEYDSLLLHFKKMGDHFVKNSIYYPKSEVNYEQSIVAPAILFLLELYTVTNDKKYFEEAKRQMPLLESFSGKQPDVHLHDIAIRHWDGYWFGKKPTYGDVMPHYWSTLTAMAFQQYAENTGDKNYRLRAIGIANNNLLNFKEDGKASCAYLYPETINGKPGRFYDAFANDQDWALYYYLQLKDSL